MCITQLNAFLEIVQNSKEISAEINRTIVTSPNQDTKDTAAVLLQKKKFKAVPKNSNSKKHVSSRLNAFSEIVQNGKEISTEMNKKTIITSPNQDTLDTTALLLQKKKFETFTKNYNYSKRHISLSYKNDIVPTTRILYGVEDLARDNLKKHQERERIGKKEKILKKMLAKYHEKETKKEVLYCQKRLSRYVSQHWNLLYKLEYKLNNARKSNAQSMEELLEEVNYVKNDKVKKAVKCLLEKLFKAMKKVPQ